MDGINFSEGATYGPQGGIVHYGDQGQIITFYQRAVLVQHQSNIEGRPVYRNADYLRILTPGERDEIDREANDLDKVRFQLQWHAYLDKRAEVPIGTMLDTLFPADPAIVEGLKAHKLFTIEQLASLSDHQIQGMPLDGAEWRAKAQRFIEATRDAGRFGELEQRMRQSEDAAKLHDEENAKLRARIAELEAGRPSGEPEAPQGRRGQRAA